MATGTTMPVKISGVEGAIWLEFEAYIDASAERSDWTGVADIVREVYLIDLAIEEFKYAAGINKYDML